MSANDPIECDGPTGFSTEILTGDAATLATRPAEATNDDGDDSWMDVHTLNLVPARRTFTFLANIVNLGRGAPSTYPDPLGESED